MEKDLPDPQLVASARQIMDAPDDDTDGHEDTPLYITWFALGHAAVLLEPDRYTQWLEQALG